ncbi:MAG TPA: ATP-dependent Clp protease proteolytic subunit [Nitrospiria bacterium]|jgi:ATP-dependent Clp protease protease subunit|nr:ATP-dependent Clp protease proteolytic subunit [Nitrospiria bacterium]
MSNQTPSQTPALAPQEKPNTHYISFSAEINQTTSETLLGVCANCVVKQVENVYLLLSTQGGSVTCGINLYNLLRGMPFHLTTHNAGNVDSIGNVIFLAGKDRYSCPNSTFMFHGVGFDIPSQMRFEEKNLRERLDSLKADQSRIGKIIVERTTLSTENVHQLFLEAVTRDPDYAKTHGIIHEIRDVNIPRGASLTQLVFKR